MKVNEIITEKFIEALNKGVCPWKKPWKVFDLCNGVSKKGYRGINQFLLRMVASDDFFFTFNQIKELGGRIKKGAKSHMVVYYKLLKKKDDESGGFPLMRFYKVFGLSDIEGMKWKQPEVKKLDFSPVEEAEKLINKCVIQIKYGGSRACYYPEDHKIDLPPKENFNSVEEYYSTAFHEIGHAMHKSTGDNVKNGFGSQNYSKEELTAEIFASLCLNFCGIDSEKCFDNSASYLSSWLEVLKKDTNFIISASSKAQKRFDAFVERKESEEIQEEESVTA
jgi:antirestriction protein ArdC